MASKISGHIQIGIEHDNQHSGCELTWENIQVSHSRLKFNRKQGFQRSTVEIVKNGSELVFTYVNKIQNSNCIHNVIYDTITLIFSVRRG